MNKQPYLIWIHTSWTEKNIDSQKPFWIDRIQYSCMSGRKIRKAGEWVKENNPYIIWTTVFNLNTYIRKAGEWVKKNNPYILWTTVFNLNTYIRKAGEWVKKNNPYVLWTTVFNLNTYIMDKKNIDSQKNDLDWYI